MIYPVLLEDKNEDAKKQWAKLVRILFSNENWWQVQIFHISKLNRHCGEIA